MSRHAPSEINENNPPMISVPAALAAVLIIGGLLAGAAFLLLSKTTTSPVNSLANDADGSRHRQNYPKIAAIFSPEVKQWESQIVAWADAWHLDANLIATIMQIESCGDAQAVSRSGALGLFQVMPYHFQPGEDAFDPQVNAQRGLGYLRQAYDARQGNVYTTFASYNGGIQGASQPEALWPQETQRYAYWGSGIYNDATSGNPISPTLEAWLNAGGNSLCSQAEQPLASTIK